MVKGSSVSVLVVDDVEDWRQVVRATLRAELGLHNFEEAADGFEAVQKAADLQPDLVMLDIGLPKLNGIEVARRIRSTSPESSIVFLTENSLSDVAEAALNSGANGYVIKSAFVRELIPAVEAAFEGRQFLSERLTALAAQPQTA